MTIGPDEDRNSSPSSMRVVRAEIDMRALAQLLWAGRRLIILTIALSLFLSLVFLRMAQPMYTAAMVLKPVGQSTDSQSSDQLRGIAFTAGLQLPSTTNVTPFQLFLSTITSTRLAQRLDQQHGLLKLIYRTRWDDTRQQWRAPQGVKAKLGMFLNWVIGLPSWRPPSADTLAGYLSNNLSVQLDEKTGLAEVQYTADDPKAAATMLYWIHSSADALIKQDVYFRTQRNVEYLRSKMDSTSVSETRRMLVDLMMLQEHTMMLMNSGLPFAAEFVDPPFPPTYQSYPKTILVITLFLFSGFIFGCIAVALRTVWKRPGPIFRRRPSNWRLPRFG